MKLQKFKWANQVKSRPMKLRKFKWANEVENWVIMLISGQCIKYKNSKIG